MSSDPLLRRPHTLFDCPNLLDHANASMAVNDGQKGNENDHNSNFTEWGSNLPTNVWRRWTVLVFRISVAHVRLVYLDKVLVIDGDLDKEASHLSLRDNNFLANSLFFLSCEYQEWLGFSKSLIYHRSSGFVTWMFLDSVGGNRRADAYARGNNSILEVLLELQVITGVYSAALVTIPSCNAVGSTAVSPLELSRHIKTDTKLAKGVS
ncbi:hypothetical protein RRG08_036449 [Elysia crispata]|uniref:Uncharacterized protein n=1 Tax=Elysia crispata TaxID=231223 RepID=A0AAE1DHG0_9GAST|nr:hypothetical protein RRG08_036449 [Elysia crispata]